MSNDARVSLLSGLLLLDVMLTLELAVDYVPLEKNTRDTPVNGC